MWRLHLATHASQSTPQPIAVPAGLLRFLICAQEARGIVKARKLGVLTPVLYQVDVVDAKIAMERVEGRTLKRMLHEKSLAGEGMSLAASSSRLHRVPGLQTAQLGGWQRRKVGRRLRWSVPPRRRAEQAAGAAGGGGGQAARWRGGARGPHHLQPHHPHLRRSPGAQPPPPPCACPVWRLLSIWGCWRFTECRTRILLLSQPAASPTPRTMPGCGCRW